MKSKKIDIFGTHICEEKTTSVGELIQFLSKYPSDWEIATIIYDHDLIPFQLDGIDIDVENKLLIF